MLMQHRLEGIDDCSDGGAWHIQVGYQAHALGACGHGEDVVCVQSCRQGGGVAEGGCEVDKEHVGRDGVGERYAGDGGEGFGELFGVGVVVG